MQLFSYSYTDSRARLKSVEFGLPYESVSIWATLVREP